VSSLDFKWHGLTAYIRDKKDYVVIKLFDLKVNSSHDPEADLKEINISILDLQVI